MITYLPKNGVHIVIRKDMSQEEIDAELAKLPKREVDPNAPQVDLRAIIGKGSSMTAVGEDPVAAIRKDRGYQD